MKPTELNFKDQCCYDATKCLRTNQPGHMTFRNILYEMVVSCKSGSYKNRNLL